MPASFSKLCAGFAVVAGLAAGSGAAADEAPVITLDLEDVTPLGLKYHNAHYASGPAKNKDFSTTCTTKASTSVTCPEPHASAYDHHDGELQVTKSLYLVNNDGVVPPTTPLETAIDYNLRAQWLLKYDASDRAGNDAEQVVFSMILDDPIAPEIVTSLKPSITLQSCDIDNEDQDQSNRQYWVFPMNNAVMDNYDGMLSDELKIEVRHPGMSAGAPATVYTQDASTTIAIDTHTLGDWGITYSAHDHAGIFGTDGEDNVAQVTGSIKVIDTIPPKVYCTPDDYKSTAGAFTAASELIETAAVPMTVSECAAECYRQQWSRIVGSKSVGEAAHEVHGEDFVHEGSAGGSHSADNAECAYFQVKDVPHGSQSGLKGTCTLYEESAHAEYGVGSGSTQGFPIQCQQANIHECGEAYIDPGASCVDIRDSLYGGAISLAAVAMEATVGWVNGSNVST